MNRFSAKDFLLFSAKNFPAQTRKAFMSQRKRGNLQGADDLISTSWATLDWNQPADIEIISEKPAFNSSGVYSPPVSVVVPENTDKSFSDTITDIIKNLTDSAPQILTAYTANKQLDACTKTNQARLSQGLPPVDCAAFAPQVQVGIAPSSQGIVTVALIGAAALGLAFLLRK